MAPSIVAIACISAAIISIVIQIAPGKPEWKHVPPLNESEDLIRFVGGDGSTMLAGRLALPPATDESVPVILLAHGLGLTQDCSLEAFVEAFTSAGFAAFTFDYATFGASEGLPRHQVKPNRHIADIHAAIAMLRRDATELGIDISRIGLWGTSLGGGHVLTVASADSSLKAVVAHVPHLQSAAETVAGMLLKDPLVGSISLLKVTGALIKWGVHALLRQGTTYVPLHGLPGSAAMMQNPGDDEGYGSIVVPRGGLYGWRNAVTVGSMIAILVYRPLNRVANVKVPSFLIAAENDTLCPAKPTQEASNLIEGAKFMQLKGVGHFDVYTGKELQTILEETVAFLTKHV